MASCGHAKKAVGGNAGLPGPMRTNWSACKRIATVTLPPNIASAGRLRIVETTTRRERPYERGKSSKRCYDWVVERGFAWMARFRRLAWGYERLPGVLAG